MVVSCRNLTRSLARTAQSRDAKRASYQTAEAAEANADLIIDSFRLGSSDHGARCTELSTPARHADSRPSSIASLVMPIAPTRRARSNPDSM